MNIKLKKAEKEDEYFILKTRNNNSRYLFNQKLISKNSHSKWFNEKLNSKKTLLLLIYYNKLRCGYIRYDLKEYIAEISIIINKNYQKKGIGSYALRISEKKLNKNLFLISKVKKNNINSLKMFLANEYQELSREKNEITLFKVLKKKKKDKFIEIINQIEKIRSKNNVNWMDILRLSFEKSPYQARKIFRQITSDDQKIGMLSKKLSK
jgi:hypothetical protein